MSTTEVTRPAAEDLLNVAETARVLGLTSTRVSQLAAADPQFPRPLKAWIRHKVWWRPDVERYAGVFRPSGSYRRPR